MMIVLQYKPFGSQSCSSFLLSRVNIPSSISYDIFKLSVRKLQDGGMNGLC